MPNNQVSPPKSKLTARSSIAALLLASFTGCLVSVHAEGTDSSATAPANTAAPSPAANNPASATSINADTLASGGAHQQLTKTAAEKQKVKEDLPNFHEVHPFLYRSGEPTLAGLKKAKEMGIKTLIDLRAPSEASLDEEKEAKELGLKYIRLTMTSAPPTDKQVDTMLNTIKEAEKDKTKGSVLVHCAHGSDRTGCMIGIWRVTQEDWGYDDTYKEMRKYWFTPKFTKLADAVKQRAKH